jgi:hypothetical protein
MMPLSWMGKVLKLQQSKKAKHLSIFDGNRNSCWDTKKDPGFGANCKYDASDALKSQSCCCTVP